MVQSPFKQSKQRAKKGVCAGSDPRYRAMYDAVGCVKEGQFDNQPFGVDPIYLSTSPPELYNEVFFFLLSQVLSDVKSVVVGQSRGY